LIVVDLAYVINLAYGEWICTAYWDWGIGRISVLSHIISENHRGATYFNRIMHLAGILFFLGQTFPVFPVFLETEGNVQAGTGLEDSST